MTSNRTTSREEGIQEMMESGGGILKEDREAREVAAEVKKILLSPDFKSEKLTETQKRFVEDELNKLAKKLHNEDRPNVRLNQVLEAGDMEQMVQFARDHILAKLENPDSDKVVPIQKMA
ncbi:hypothetical protein KAR91_55020 [Candidatus Pacearchaeota archaeon]|nr:hypothetical protein [Candidatus Pacearchaeota archaeon]